MRKITLIVIFSLWLGCAASTGWARSSPEPQPKGPEPDSKVLMIFVDSLRPDVVDEMVSEGRLPNIQKLFYDQGRRFGNFFTSYPSLTVNAFTCLITGKWPDQTGLKAQSLFERFPVRKKHFLKRLFFIPERFPRNFNMLNKPEKAPEILKQNKIKTLYDYLGEKYHASLVPVSPAVIPWAWPNIAANDVQHPYFVATEAHDKLDDLNGKYALQYMVPDTRGRLFIVWFSQPDTEQHRHEWGQFSDEAKNKMENIDRWIGKIRDGFIRESDGGRHPPYIILFSDHGSYGGKDGIYNQPFYISRDFFYKTLKMNVRGPDHTISHPGTDLGSYVYIDNMGRGQSQIFLPVGDSLSGNWQRPNTLYELEHYGLGPNREPVDLIRELLDINLEKTNKFPDKIDPHPVDLVFVKLSGELIYVARRNGSEALIHIRHKEGNPSYRYQPVQNVSQDKEGHLTFDESSGTDPFGYFKDPKFRSEDPAKFLQEFHDDREWLDATYETAYPDAIPALSRFFIWKPELSALAKSRDPDLCISAAPGWNFRIEDVPGSDHGAILRDSMLGTLMISGPGIRAGVDMAPRRVIDVTPTLLQLVGFTGKAELDSVPIEGIYEDR